MDYDLSPEDMAILSRLEDSHLSPPEYEELFPVRIVVTGEPLSEDSQLWYVCGSGPFFDEEGNESGYEESSFIESKDCIGDSGIEGLIDLYSTNEDAWVEVEWVEPGGQHEMR